MSSFYFLIRIHVYNNLTLFHIISVKKRSIKHGEKQKKINCSNLLLIFATILSGCEYEKEVVEKDTTTDTIKENEVGIPSLSQTLSVKDEDFSLLVDYDLGNYNLNKWHVTDNKNIGMTVKTQNLPEGYEVSLDHVHADITIKSTETQVKRNNTRHNG